MKEGDERSFQAGFLFGTFVEPDEGGDMFHRNLCSLSMDCIPLRLIRQTVLLKLHKLINQMEVE
jgi:hypothetical protein